MLTDMRGGIYEFYEAVFHENNPNNGIQSF